jgi:hypothetical protein
VPITVEQSIAPAHRLRSDRRRGFRQSVGSAVTKRSPSVGSASARAPALQQTAEVRRKREAIRPLRDVMDIRDVVPTAIARSYAADPPNRIVGSRSFSSMTRRPSRRRPTDHLKVRKEK